MVQVVLPEPVGAGWRQPSGTGELLRAIGQAVARAPDLLAGWSRRAVAVRAAFLAGAAAWGLYVFPLAAARTVPAALYAPLLPLVQIVGSN